MTERRDLVLLSGGMDSTTALARRMREGTARLCVSVHYGQRHVRELRAAAGVAAHYDLPHLVLDLSSWGALLTGSALTDSSVEVPHGHYAAPTMSITVVPNRNATLLMAAAGIAQSRGLTHVVAAMHAGDHPIYPDCRPEFLDALDRALGLATENRVSLDAPFTTCDKTEIARQARALSAPLHLTWSCYEGGAIHCGRCGTCVERREAFQRAGVDDPTVYAARAA
ncbi:MAG: 7-cyano-7-deazaguanine synthase QueC [Pseudonocardiaceae bacterium]|nr:7-cyano-7-deazaguanine synthase QueC [Pseudonocardiaceae bacterium]